MGKLRRSRHISVFRKKDEIYVYHDLWGFILQMDRKVLEFLEAFGDEGRPFDEVARKFRKALPPEQMEGFVGTFEQHRCLVSPRADEMADAFEKGHPTRAAWMVAWSARPEEVILSYKDRALRRVVLERLTPLGSRFFASCEGDRPVAQIADALQEEFPRQDVRAELRRLVFHLTHSDRQVLKLTDRPLYEYLAFPPPYLRSVMPYPRIEEATEGEGSDVIDLTQFHRTEIEDAAAQFDVEETTLSHMFREPHDALGGKSYGEAFAEAMDARGLIPEDRPCEVVEVGGGVGFFALNFLRAVRQRHGGTYDKLKYTIVDLSQVLQDSQRMLNFELGGKVRYVLGNASRSLPLRDESVDLLISNEVIADLETVRLKREEIGYAHGHGHDSKTAAYDLVRRHGLDVQDAPEVFWLNLGALRLVEELKRVLKPGAAAVLIEFGGENRYPVESTHLAHSEFSIHFGHLRRVAESVGLACELTDIMDLVGLRGDVKVLATTRSYFESLRALMERRGVSLQKLAYTEKQFAALCGERLDPKGLRGLVFKPVRERALALHPPEFLVAVIRKPEARP